MAAYALAASLVGRFACECEGPLSPPRKTRLRVGSVPGIRDEPVNAALKQKMYDQDSENVLVEWVQCPDCLEAMGAMLSAGLVDVALAFTEDAMVHLSSSRALQVCGTFSAAPRRWRVLVPHATFESTADLRGRRVGIPVGVGAKLMMSAVEDELGWASGPPTAVPQGSFRVALGSMIEGNGSIQGLFWECNVEEGFIPIACETLCEVTMPWPSHVFIASRETVRAKLGTIKQFIRMTGGLCKQMKAQRHSTMLHYMMMHYSLCEEDANRWLNDVIWNCALDIDETTFSRPFTCLRKLEMVPHDFCYDAFAYVARGVSLFRSREKGGYRIHSYTNESISSDDEMDQEGVASTVAGTRAHHLLQAHHYSTQSSTSRRVPAALQPFHSNHSEILQNNTLHDASLNESLSRVQTTTTQNGRAKDSRIEGG